MAITHEVIFRIYSKVNQVIYSSIPIYSSGFKALASIAFEIFCWQEFIHIFSKGHNSGKGHNPDGKKIRVSYFFMKNPYMKFQNPSMHGSEVMLCTKKCNGRTHGRTHARTNVPEAICPSNFFEVGGIKTFPQYRYLLQGKQALPNISWTPRWWKIHDTITTPNHPRHNVEEGI